LSLESNITGHIGEKGVYLFPFGSNSVEKPASPKILMNILIIIELEIKG
jgi:hypothetical protein